MGRSEHVERAFRYLLAAWLGWMAATQHYHVDTIPLLQHQLAAYEAREAYWRAHHSKPKFQPHASSENDLVVKSAHDRFPMAR